MTRPLAPRKIISAARKRIDRFGHRHDLYPLPRVVVSTGDGLQDARDTLDPKAPWPLEAKRSADGLTVFLPEDRVREVAYGVWAGALDRVLARYVIAIQPEAYTWNFRKTILPMFPVSGAALQFIRELMAFVADGVKEIDATRMILDLGAGDAQMHFQFAAMVPSATTADTYQKAMSRRWVRALVLCRLLAGYGAVTPLSVAGVWPQADTFWHRCHDYLLPEDAAILEQMAAAAGDTVSGRFSMRLAAVFDVVRENLL